jgi:hypothetical protein
LDAAGGEGVEDGAAEDLFFHGMGRITGGEGWG